MQSHKITINGNYIVSHSICHRAMCVCLCIAVYNALYHLQAAALLCACLRHLSVIHKPPDMPSNCRSLLLPQCHLYTHTSENLWLLHFFAQRLRFVFVQRQVTSCVRVCERKCVEFAFNTLIVGSLYYVIGRDMCIVAIATVYTIDFHAIPPVVGSVHCADDFMGSSTIECVCGFVDGRVGGWFCFHYVSMKQYHTCT